MRYYEDALGIYYEPAGDGRYITVTDADKKLGKIEIPEYINGIPVKSIAKKAFLGCKILRSVKLPKGIDSIGEWAFAFCDNLNSIELARDDIKWGKGVFKNDKRLKRISIYPDCATDKMTCMLLAAAPVIMDAEYLLDIKHAGNPEWIRKWDTRLEHLLNLADDEGYHLYVLCGEEDLHFDYEEYLEYNREKKSELCMLRLINDKGLSDRFGKRLTDYLLEHTAGCDSDAAVRVLIKKHGDEEEYYRLLLGIKAITADNLDILLHKMGDRHTQMKAYLIEQCGSATEEFFDDLML